MNTKLNVETNFESAAKLWAATLSNILNCDGDIEIGESDDDWTGEHQVVKFVMDNNMTLTWTSKCPEVKAATKQLLKLTLDLLVG